MLPPCRPRRSPCCRRRWVVIILTSFVSLSRDAALSRRHTFLFSRQKVTSAVMAVAWHDVDTPGHLRADEPHPHPTHQPPFLCQLIKTTKSIQPHWLLKWMRTSAKLEPTYVRLNQSPVLKTFNQTVYFGCSSTHATKAKAAKERHVLNNIFHCKTLQILPKLGF
jgi:hypothetical protein